MKGLRGSDPSMGQSKLCFVIFLSFDINLSLRPHIFVNSWKTGSPWLRIASPALWFTAPGLSFSRVTLDKAVTPPSLLYVYFSPIMHLKGSGSCLLWNPLLRLCAPSIPQLTPLLLPVYPAQTPPPSGILLRPKLNNNLHLQHLPAWSESPELLSG